MMFGRSKKPAFNFDRSRFGTDLDAYLAKSEAKVDHLRPALAKRILWANTVTRAKTPISIVYLHGFSASSDEIRPVPDRVASHLGANLYLARLAGHGADGAALGRATVAEWIEDVAEAIAVGERIGERVVVMATSTGASLATWALSEPGFSDHVAAAVFLSPNYRLQARGAFLLHAPFAGLLIRLFLGPTRGFEPLNAEQARLWTCNYPSKALLPLAEAMRLADRAPVERANVPALFLYSPQDTVVSPQRIEVIARRWGAPQRLIAVSDIDDPASHVIAGDALSPGSTNAVVEHICGWLDDMLGPPKRDKAFPSS